MNKLRLNLCMAAMVAALSSTAQNPYADVEATEAAMAVEVKYAGQKPGIVDFVTAYYNQEAREQEIGLGEDMTDLWDKHLKNSALDEGEKVTVDAKNGFVSFEKTYAGSDDKGSAQFKDVVEMCYWNCSDGKHKVFGVSETRYRDGKVTVTGEIQLGLYNNDTHKIIFSVFEWESEFSGIKTDVANPIVSYALPRSGKNITATIHNSPSGELKVQFVWDGLQFKQE